MATWLCVQNCGACCHLDPAERPDLESYLTPTELEQYLSLVGDDGWCIHYDRDRRNCSIYEDRPTFCRVNPATFEQMFGVDATEFNDFAIACCEEQIIWLYGEDSPEMAHFDSSVNEKQ
ncbi:MAG: YkgJ family cysteine cluster protein [Spirulinaceae cyanobacterium]